jgi:hypothetical protein
MTPAYAFLGADGAIYTIRLHYIDHFRKIKDPDGPKYMGYRDGQPCGLFRSKKEFEAFVERQRPAGPRGPYAMAADRAEGFCTLELSRKLEAFYPLPPTMQ